MNFGAMAFMLVTWLVVIIFTVYCFVRLLKDDKNRQ